MILENKGTSPKEPCLVQAGQGFSVLYNDRLLYSKYAPDRAIKQAVEQLTLLPQSLIILYSPCLWLGLKELLQKLPEHCEIYAVEQDELLFKLAQSELEKLYNDDFFKSKKNIIHLIKPAQIEQEIKPVYRFRRCCTLEMSGGAFFNKELYGEVTVFAQNHIAAFWKNRITLVKLGRLFSRNFIKNLKSSPAAFSIPLKSPVFDRPVIIFGAGESTETFIKESSPQMLNKCITIAVDAVLPALLAHGIDPDFTVAVEGQLAIEKAYIGTGKSNTIIIGDTVSRTGVLRHSKGKNLYFCSEYSEGKFFDKALEEEILPVKVPGLGSVGLTAVYLALLMRKSEDVPVFVTGLDFSYTKGATHTRGVPHHLMRLNSTNRFNPVENWNAAFKTGAQFTEGKNGAVVTDTALLGYARLFVQYFNGTPGLFDAGKSGLNLGIPLVMAEQIEQLVKNLPDKNKEDFLKLLEPSRKDELIKSTKQYLKAEKSALLRIKELLTKGNKASPAPSPDLNKELFNLLQEREYLYLHFPDGWSCDVSNLSFLKRVRSEIDFFLKDLS